MKQDEAIQWIRDVRREISHEMHNDIREFVKFHRELRPRSEARNESARATDLARPATPRPVVPGG